MNKREDKVNKFLEDMLKLQGCKVSNKFTGELAKNRQPRKWPMVGATLLLDEDSKKEAIAKCNVEYKKKSMEYFLEDYQKLLLLCEHYGIDQATKDEHSASHIMMLIRLSIVLAEELKVPAFTEKKRRGPKEKWTEYNMGLLIASVDKQVKAKQAEGKKEDEEKSVSWACKNLATKEPWKSFIPKNTLSKQGEALRVKYYKARKSEISKVIGEAMIIGTRTDEDLWDSLLKGL